MPPRRNKEKFQQLTEFERGRIIGLREEGFSYHAIGARVQWNSSTVMRVWKQWSCEHRTTRKTGFPSRQTTDGCVCNGLMSTEPDKLIGTKLFFQMNHASIYGTIMAAFVLDAMSVNAAFQSAFFERHTCLRVRVMPEVVPFLQGAIFQQDNARPHVTKTIRDFCSAQHMQRLLWPAYSPDMSPIEHVWDLVDWCLARDPYPAAPKDELLLRIRAIWALRALPQADIQNLFGSMPRHIAAFIIMLGGYTKY
ncbi:transposable element Tcb2 transposase [Trichonephila clavipes]|nr:transposable element Tcb2 transposase [Trichonephila clavipes]